MEYSNNSNVPLYAYYNAPEKFQAIIGIIGTRLRQHPNAVCSYSGGSDSDILIDLVETAREMFSLPPVQYVFFNTGLEMDATKRHVKDVANKYNVSIEEIRPEKNIVLATREFGIPFASKIISSALEVMQCNNIPITIKEEYDDAQDKSLKRSELRLRYSNSEQAINFLCCCDKNGNPKGKSQTVISSLEYLYDFMKETPPKFKISAKCCKYCKKQPAINYQRNYEMVITGERKAEGGARANDRNGTMCFHQEYNGQYRFKPLYYVSDKDKQWYKEYANIRYSDAYEVYGLKRTGCCGCSISANAARQIDVIKEYEPNVAKAAWNIFGESYSYRKQYEEYKLKQWVKNKFGQTLD